MKKVLSSIMVTALLISSIGAVSVFADEPVKSPISVTEKENVAPNAAETAKSKEGKAKIEGSQPTKLFLFKKGDLLIATIATIAAIGSLGYLARSIWTYMGRNLCGGPLLRECTAGDWFDGIAAYFGFKNLQSPGGAEDLGQASCSLDLNQPEVVSALKELRNNCNSNYLYNPDYLCVDNIVRINGVKIADSAAFLNKSVNFLTWYQHLRPSSREALPSPLKTLYSLVESGINCCKSQLNGQFDHKRCSFNDGSDVGMEIFYTRLSKTFDLANVVFSFPEGT